MDSRLPDRSPAGSSFSLRELAFAPFWHSQDRVQIQTPRPAVPIRAWRCHCADLSASRRAAQWSEAKVLPCPTRQQTARRPVYRPWPILAVSRVRFLNASRSANRRASSLKSPLGSLMASCHSHEGARLRPQWPYRPENRRVEISGDATLVN